MTSVTRNTVRRKGGQLLIAKYAFHAGLWRLGHGEFELNDTACTYHRTAKGTLSCPQEMTNTCVNEASTVQAQYPKQLEDSKGISLALISCPGCLSCWPTDRGWVVTHLLTGQQEQPLRMQSLQAEAAVEKATEVFLLSPSCFCYA
eukprot:4759168-Amphidinium_carterae.1